MHIFGLVFSHPPRQCTAILPVQFQCPNSTLLSITWWRLETSRKLNLKRLCSRYLNLRKKSLWLKSPKKRCQINDLLLRWIVLRDLIWHLFLEIKPPLVSISSCQRNLMKTYHTEADTSGISKIASKFFFEFFEQSS